MRQVFRARPWVLPPEPAKLAELFRDGHVVTLDAGATFRHGGTEGYVALLLEGLVTFSFLDIRGNYHTFALVLPGRTIGDLDALNPNRTSVIAECIRPSRALMIPNSQYRRGLRLPRNLWKCTRTCPSSRRNPSSKARLPISLLTQIGDCAFCCFLSFWKGEDQLVPTNGTNVPCLFQSLKSRESSLQRVRG